MNEAQKSLAQMSDKELDDLILRLGRYTRRECNRLDWRTGNSNELPGGETTGSVVSKAFELVLSGRRKWDPQDAPDLAKYLMNVMDSLLSHLVESNDNTMFEVPPEAGTVSEAAWHGATGKHQRSERSVDWMRQTTLSPEQEWIEEENTAAAEKAMALLEDSIKNDAELIAILNSIREGCDKNGEIAEYTGIAIRDVENAKKRLDRKIASVNKQIMNSEDNGFISETRSNDNGR